VLLVTDDIGGDRSKFVAGLIIHSIHVFAGTQSVFMGAVRAKCIDWMAAIEMKRRADQKELHI
jgi:hypothetical protein